MGCRYILVCGGVVSSVGKGVIASSIGRLLKTAGTPATVIKIDPYLNYNAGSLRPTDHGEVFILDDGTEVDLDFGSYERFLDVTLSQLNSITSGRVYSEVIANERNGLYRGKTVQIIPHLTDHIQRQIERAAAEPVDPDRRVPAVCIIELGGVLGDIESHAFVESLRRLRAKMGPSRFMTVGVDYVPLIGQEHKTKPTQSSLRKARELGIPYDLIVCRSEHPVPGESLEKIATFSDTRHIVNVPDGEIHSVPLVLRRMGVLDLVAGRLSLHEEHPRLPDSPLADALLTAAPETPPGHRVVIGVVSKYATNHDSYVSIKEALRHAGTSLRVAVEIEWIDTEMLGVLADGGWEGVRRSDAIIVPGGFGRRGVEEMVRVIQHCRETGKPLLGICLGFQLMLIEHCRNLLGMADSISEEFWNEAQADAVRDGAQAGAAPSMFPVRDHQMGMKLGLHSLVIPPGSRLHRMYSSHRMHPSSGSGELLVKERFRHRYGVNEEAVPLAAKGGLVPVGRAADDGHCVAFEREDHPWFVGVQYHPEFLSRPGKPGPVFVALVDAATRRVRD